MSPNTDSPNALFESAVPEEEASDDFDQGSFEPLPLPEEVSYNTLMWDNDEEPIEWLFASEGRLALATYAMAAVDAGDPIYLNKSETSDKAGVSRHSAHRHIDDLVTLGIFETRGQGYNRYRPNADSRILKAMATVNEEIAARATEPDMS
jgi:hypothetical protein